MRTHGHMVGNNTHWGLSGVGVGREGHWRGWRGWGGITWGEIPGIVDGGVEEANHIEIPSHAS